MASQALRASPSGTDSTSVPGIASGPVEAIHPPLDGTGAPPEQPQLTVRADSLDRTRTARRYPDPEEARIIGLELEVLRRRTRVDLDVLSDLAGFSGAKVARRVEQGQPTRASRLRPWLAGLGLDEPKIADFLARHAAGIAEESTAPPTVRPARPRPAKRPKRSLAPPAELEGMQRAALGVLLWHRRVSLGLKRSDVGALAGSSRVNVWRAEHGLRRLSLALFRRWCEALGYDAIEIMDIASKHHVAIAWPRGSLHASAASPGGTPTSTQARSSERKPSP